MKGIIFALIVLFIIIGVSFLIWNVSRPSSKSENVIYGLTVTKSGSGTVTSSPTGINCGSTCSANFNSGTSVTLTAASATNYFFSGWSGVCTGNSTTCVLTMNSDKSVTATFAVIPPSNNTSSNETEEKPPIPPE